MKDWNGNANSIYKTLGASNHTVEDREVDDYYATDPIAIDKLLTVECPSRFIWECACGENHLAKRLREKGYCVHASDIVERNSEIDSKQDFLGSENNYIVGEGCMAFDILTNPPYKYAKEFVLKALDLVSEGHKVYMFLKLTFLEGKTRYKELFSKYPPKTIYVFSERIKCAKNGNFEDISSSAVAYAWYVWEKGYQGKTTIEWI